MQHTKRDLKETEVGPVAVRGRANGNRGQESRRPQSLTIERTNYEEPIDNQYTLLKDSPLWNSLSGDKHARDALAAWNSSPFVPSYPNDFGAADETHPVEDDENDSSHGEPWHCDVKDVVTGDMVAHGSFGMVFKGVYRGEKVAVKLLLIPEASSKEELDRLKSNFRQEIDLWNTLSHPNIVQFVGGYIVPPRWAIVTEFLDGGSLKAYLLRQQRRKLSATSIRAMALDIARGMEYLHEHNIMHRDLKSGNLLLDGNGSVKVADFGLARFEVDDAVNHTAETGTIRWMAPEVICHQPYTRKVDVYSFGIVLWELCTSLVPFEGMSFVQLAHAVATDNHRPPTHDVPPALAKLMKQCWDQDASKRPDFADVVRFLESCSLSMPARGSHQSARQETETPVDLWSRPTESLRGRRVVGIRNRHTTPSHVANTDDVLSDEEAWVSIRRQCRCTII